VVKASEDACGNYQPPPRKQVGPAFSFGVKTRASQSAMTSGPGKDSPGPAAYDAVIPTSDAVRGHVSVGLCRLNQVDP
jgi:hypothetical protein